MNSIQYRSPNTTLDSCCQTVSIVTSRWSHLSDIVHHSIEWCFAHRTHKRKFRTNTNPRDLARTLSAKIIPHKCWYDGGYINEDSSFAEWEIYLLAARSLIAPKINSMESIKTKPGPFMVPASRTVSTMSSVALVR